MIKKCSRELRGKKDDYEFQKRIKKKKKRIKKIRRVVRRKEVELRRKEKD